MTSGNETIRPDLRPTTSNATTPLEVALRDGNAARDCAIRTGDEALVVP